MGSEVIGIEKLGKGNTEEHNLRNKGNGRKGNVIEASSFLFDFLLHW